MPSIEKREDSYYVTVSNGYDKRGKKIRKYRTFRNDNNLTPSKWEKEVQRLAFEFEKEVHDKHIIDSTMTVRELKDHWFEFEVEKKRSPKTALSYEDELNSKILPNLGDIPLNELNPTDISKFLNTLLKDGVRKDGRKGGYSNRTIQLQLQILNVMLNHAVIYKLLKENPSKDLTPPKNINYDGKNKVKSFSADEMSLLLKIFQKEQLKYQVGFGLAWSGALRRGEILALTWRDINFDKRTLQINKSCSYLSRQIMGEKKGMHTKEPKNSSSNRTIKIPLFLTNLLRQYKKLQDKEREKLGTIWDSSWKEHPFILTQEKGKGMSRSTLSNRLKCIIKRHNEKVEKDCSIQEEEKASYQIPVLTLHNLRHTSASHLNSNNVDILSISKMLGHARVSTTSDIYLHKSDATSKEAADLFDTFYKDNVSDS